jgi:hypothetical protein
LDSSPYLIKSGKDSLSLFVLNILLFLFSENRFQKIPQGGFSIRLGSCELIQLQRLPGPDFQITPGAYATQTAATVKEKGGSEGESKNKR